MIKPTNYKKNFVRNSKESTSFIFQNIPLWIASVVIGLVAVLYTEVIHFAEESFIKIYNTKNWLIFIVSPIFFFISFVLVNKYAKYANASGIPQVMAALDLPKKPAALVLDKLLSLRIIVVKILSSFFIALGGGVIGREGPTIQIAASILHVVNKILPSYWPKISQKLMIITGSAAGLAAAFNTPLGGIVFAIEELSKNSIKNLRTTVFSAVIISGFTAQTILGPYLMFGYPRVDPHGFQFFLILLLVTIICCLIGAYFGVFIFKLNAIKRKFNDKKKLIFGFSMVFVFTLIVFFTNTDTAGSGHILLNRLLFEENKSIEWYVIPARLLNGIISFTNGGAGGIFAPVLSFGGAIGAYIGNLFALDFTQVNMLVLIGMVSFLTAFTRSPFTCAILVLEMTDRHSVIFYLLVAAWIANLIAGLIEKRSFYEKTAEVLVNELVGSYNQKLKKEKKDKSL